MSDNLPDYPHEGAAILALAYYAGLANPDGKIKYGIGLVPRSADLGQGTDADWVYTSRWGRREFLRLDFTTGGRKTFEKKRRRSVRMARVSGRKVQITPFSPSASVSLLSDPCFRRAYEALTDKAKVGWGGDILSTTKPCPVHGNECPEREDPARKGTKYSFCEELLNLGRWLHNSQLPRYAQIPPEQREWRLREK